MPESNILEFVKAYKVDDYDIIIRLKQHDDLNILIDLNYLMPNLSDVCLISEVVADLDILMPLSFIGDPISILIQNLELRIKDHVKKFGRILQSDLGLYVAEAIIILEAYTNQIFHQSMAHEKKKIFHLMLVLV